MQYLPKTSCTDAPFVNVLWYAWIMKFTSKKPNKTANEITLIWNKAEILGERSMKSTRSSDNQWKLFRKSKSVNKATNLGEKSSLKKTNILVKIKCTYDVYTIQNVYKDNQTYLKTVNAKHVSVTAYQLRSTRCSLEN